MNFSLIGTIGAYLGALIITPLLAIFLLGTNFISLTQLIIIMIELILIPVIIARILIATRIARFLEPVKGGIINWSFFLVTYTIVGLNQDIFLNHPKILLPVVFISVASTFLLGWIIEGVSRLLKIEQKTITSMVLLGTLKNYGLAGGLALTFFNHQTAVPSSVAVVFMVIYIIWLEIKRRRLK
jgi:BASS family bile acid:Na+ symporter